MFEKSYVAGLNTKNMVRLSFLYDPRDQTYPILYTGVLAFVIITCLPLNLGLSKIPAVDTFAILVVGFASLFMLGRNQQVGVGLLNHLHISDKREVPVIQQEVSKNRLEFNSNVPSGFRDIKLDPFLPLQNIIEHIITSHDDNMDTATRVRLEQILTKLQRMSRES